MNIEISLRERMPQMKIFKLTYKLKRTILIMLILFGLVSILYHTSFIFKTNDAFSISRTASNFNNDDLHNLRYTIVIDAGSTGSRIHVFKLLHDDMKKITSRFDIRLLNEELFVKVKPGLSSYANNPLKAALSIKPLLDKALKIVPRHHHKFTKITLKATAGLRLVSEEISNKILHNVNKLFERYPFLKDDVSIMDGRFEGIYSWLTLNYALGNLENSNETEICSLDLGGGSTQVTFVPTDIYSSRSIDANDLVKFNIDEIKYEIYAKSFLGFGLMSARMNIFQTETQTKLLNSSSKSNNLSSVCMPFGHKSRWLQQGVVYDVNGPHANALHSFEHCHKQVKKIIQDKFTAPSELKDKQLFAFSFFYDRLNASRALPNSFGGPIQIERMLDIAKLVSRVIFFSVKACDNKDELVNMKVNSNDNDFPFLCMDLTFIYALLTDGYRLPHDKHVHVYKEVNKMEISWALGAAFHMLNDA